VFWHAIWWHRLKKTSEWDHKANLWCGPKRYFFHEKKYFFFDFIFFLTEHALTSKKKIKKAVMLVFLGTKRSWEFFLVFRKKSKKMEKMRFFWKKAYGLIVVFTKSCVISYHNKYHFLNRKKNAKKKRFSFFETFFLKWKLDIYFCPFWNLKKNFPECKKLSIFSISLNYLVKWRVIFCELCDFCWIFGGCYKKKQKDPW
jgi:hypothetical protein